jgi:hypothetical protein
MDNLFIGLALVFGAGFCFGACFGAWVMRPRRVTERTFPRHGPWPAERLKADCHTCHKQAGEFECYYCAKGQTKPIHTEAFLKEEKP